MRRSKHNITSVKVKIRPVRFSNRINWNNPIRAIYETKENVIRDSSDDKYYINNLIDDDDILRFEQIITDLISKKANINRNSEEYSLTYSSDNNNTKEVSMHVYFYKRYTGNFSFYAYDRNTKNEFHYNGTHPNIESVRQKLDEYADEYNLYVKNKSFNGIEEVLGLDLNTIMRKNF